MTIRRRAAGVTYRKLAISLPGDLAAAIEAEVRARQAPSVSAFISQAVEEKIERDRLQEALDEVWREAPMTEEERAWADRILLG
jgi:metal-responsive CopG/Arc/MetJ family transcriptional regulator